MDDKKTDEIKQENEVDNSKLEELIKQDITPKMQKEVFELLKESRLFLPVDFGPDAFKDVKNSKPGDKIDGPSGFNIKSLTDHNGNMVVPLFTSDEMIEEAGVHTSAIVIYMSDLASMLKQTDKYSVLAINPLTEYDLNMPMEAFLALFEDAKINENNDKLKELLKQKPSCDDELKEILLSSVMIVGCIDADNGANFVLIWDNDQKPHMPLFTDIDEYKKMFGDNADIYPNECNFIDLINVAEENLVINPASESLILNPDIFRE